MKRWREKKGRLGAEQGEGREGGLEGGPPMGKTDRHMARQPQEEEEQVRIHQRERLPGKSVRDLAHGIAETTFFIRLSPLE